LTARPLCGAPLCRCTIKGYGRFVLTVGRHKSRFGSGLGKNGPLGSSFQRALVRARLAALPIPKLARRVCYCSAILWQLSGQTGRNADIAKTVAFDLSGHRFRDDRSATEQSYSVRRI